MSLVKKYKVNTDIILGRAEGVESPVISHFAITKNNVYKKDAIAEAKEILGKAYPQEDITNIAAESAIQQWLYKFHDTPFPGPMDGEEKFTFIDLFAGIGVSEWQCKPMGVNVCFLQSMISTPNKLIAQIMARRHLVI